MRNSPREPAGNDANVSRRRFLTSASLALGAAPVAALASAEAAAGALPRHDLAAANPTVYDVAAFGAQGDGTADDTNAIQAAIDAAATHGGGTVVFPAGTFRVTRALNLASQIVLRGAGVRATVLRKSNGAGRYAVLRSPGFDPPMQDPTPIHTFSLQNLSVDGNAAGGAQGNGVQVAAYGYTLFNVSIFGCEGRGLWTEYPGILPPDGHGVEAMVTSLSVHNCAGGGIYWNGPHDSQWSNVVVYHCGPNVETGSTTRGVETGPRAAGLRAVNCHVWGLNHEYAWWLANEASGLVNCTGEGAERAQVVIAGFDAQIVGGKYFSARDTLGDQTVGIQVGAETGGPVAGAFVNTKIVNCNQGSLKLVNDAGIARYVITAWQTQGEVVALPPGGQLPASNRYDIQVAGGATTNNFQSLKQVTIQEPMLARRSFEARGDVSLGGPTTRISFFGAAPRGRSTGWSTRGLADIRSLETSSDIGQVRAALATLIEELKRYGLLAGPDTDRS